QTLFDGGDLFGRAVGRQHDLFLQVVQSVKRMKKFLLGALFAGDKFDIVNQQDIHGAETVSKADHAVKAERIDHFVGEFFGVDISEQEARVERRVQIAD